MPWLNNNFRRQGLQLYRQFVYLSKIYPGDSKYILNRARDEFYSYADVKDEKEIKKAFSNAKWYLKEIEGTAKLAKYRFMKRNYEEKKSENKE